MLVSLTGSPHDGAQKTSAPTTPATSAAPTASAVPAAEPAVTAAAAESAAPIPSPASIPVSARELAELLDKIDKLSPAVFSWPEAQTKKELGPEKRIRVLPHLGSGRDIELQVQTGAANQRAIPTRDLATVLGLKTPKIHQLPVTDGPVYRLSDDTTDTLHYKGLTFEVDITLGDAKSSGVNLRSKGNFSDLSGTSHIVYVMINAPEEKKP